MNIVGMLLSSSVNMKKCNITAYKSAHFLDLLLWLHNIVMS